MITEGERLKRVLVENGRNASDLARACNVSRTAVDRYLAASKVGKNAWPTLRAGLVKLGIDPTKVKTEDEIRDVLEDLRPLVSGFDLDELSILKTVLEASPAARERLLYFIDGRLLSKK